MDNSLFWYVSSVILGMVFICLVWRVVDEYKVAYHRGYGDGWSEAWERARAKCAERGVTLEDDGEAEPE